MRCVVLRNTAQYYTVGRRSKNTMRVKVTVVDIYNRVDIREGIFAEPSELRILLETWARWSPALTTIIVLSLDENKHRSVWPIFRGEGDYQAAAITRRAPDIIRGKKLCSLLHEDVDSVLVELYELAPAAKYIS
jgi:hypothetical protein